MLVRHARTHSLAARAVRLAVLVALVVATSPAALVAEPSAAIVTSEIYGKITDVQDAQGITGAHVKAYHMAWAPWEGGGPKISHTVLSDEHGDYSIEEPFDEVVVRPGSEDFWVEVYANGYFNESTQFEWDGTGFKQADVALAHAGDIKVVGTVVDIDSGDPIQGVELGCGWEAGDDVFHQTRLSNVDGEFALHGVPNGTDFFVNVWGWNIGYEDYSETFYFEGPDVLNIEVALRKADPRFWVDPENNWLQGDYWPAGTEVTITIGDLGDPDFETSLNTHDFGGFGYWIDPDHWDVSPGDTVTVWDGETTKVHVVSDLAVSDIDFAADTVSGNGTPLADLTVWLTTHYGMIDPFDWIPVETDADADGAWTADFSDDFDITSRSGGEVFEWDEDRDATRIAWGFDPDNPGPALEVAGADRIATAIEASRLAFPHYAETVVIATGRNWPDALGGTALAGAVGGPILLVNTNSAPSAVLAEIERLGAGNAIVLGGEAAVGPAAYAAIEGVLGDDNVERIWGENRYQTADKVALRVIAELGDGYDGTAFVATGAQFADAVAAAPLAASQRWPLFLVNPVRTTLYAATEAAMADVEDVLVLGGTAAVSDALEAAVDALVPGEVIRLEGETRYETAVAVATYGVENTKLGWNRVGIATGEDYPDALAGGVLQGMRGSVMLLTRPASLRSETRAALELHADEIDTVTYFGGLNAVSDAVRQAVETAAGVMP